MKILIIITTLLLFFLLKNLNQYFKLDPVKTLNIPVESHLVSFSPNTQMVAITTGKIRRSKVPKNYQRFRFNYIIKILDSSDEKTLQSFRFPTLLSRIFPFNPDNAFAFSPDNTLIAASGYNGEIRLWRIEDGQLINSLIARNHSKLITKFIAFTPDGKNLLTMVSDISLQTNILQRNLSSIDLWDLENGRIRYSLSGKYTGIDVSPDGKLFALTSEDNVPTLYQLSDGTLLRRIKTSAIPRHCSTPKFSPDGRQLGFISDHPIKLAGKKINIHNIENGEIKHLLYTAVIVNHKKTESINDFVFSPDGHFIAASYSAVIKAGLFIFEERKILSSHGAIRIWRLNNEPEIRRLPFLNRNRRVHTWEVEDGVFIRANKWSQILRGHKLESSILKFSSDGKFLISTGQDNTIRWWKMPLRSTN